MNNRPFGKEKTTVSEIGLGAWQIGGDWGDVDEDTADAILKEAIERGVKFIDTADVYGNGKSEARIGRFLKRTSVDVFVATKVGRFPKPGWPGNFSYSSFLEHTEASLSRLGVDSLDLTQLHCLPTEILQRGEVFDWLRRLKQDGKIKRFGASVETIEEANLCLEQEGISSLQIIFNIFRQRPVYDLFDEAVEKGVAIIVRLPLASGLLTGKFNGKETFPEDDHRNYNRDGEKFNVGETFAGIPFDKGVELANKLAAYLTERMTLHDLALRWILDHEAVTVVIPGAKSAQQVRENVHAAELLPLPEQLHEELAGFYRNEVENYIRGPY
jgi:aryl-alcohol dehydrogenase-like predicted oxidoreductase